jgi:hypothetical protein
LGTEAGTTCGNETGPGATCDAVTASATGACVLTTTYVNAGPLSSAGVGGPITPGTYDLSAEIFYGPSANGYSKIDAHRETFVISDVTDSGFALQHVRVSGSRVESSQGTVTVSGSAATYTPTCPPPGDGGDQGIVASYTGYPPTFSWYVNQSGGTLIQSFTLR